MVNSGHVTNAKILPIWSLLIVGSSPPKASGQITPRDGIIPSCPVARMLIIHFRLLMLPPTITGASSQTPPPRTCVVRYLLRHSIAKHKATVTRGKEAHKDGGGVLNQLGVS